MLNEFSILSDLKSIIGCILKSHEVSNESHSFLDIDILFLLNICTLSSVWIKQGIFFICSGPKFIVGASIFNIDSETFELSNAIK